MSESLSSPRLILGPRSFTEEASYLNLLFVASGDSGVIMLSLYKPVPASAATISQSIERTQRNEDLCWQFVVSGDL